MVIRKASRRIDFDDLVDGILGDDGFLIASTIKIHLALEAIIVETLSDTRSDDRLYRMSFPNKTNELVKRGFATALECEAYNAFNNFRNDYAHIFGHTVTLSDLIRLARQLEECGIDFSDPFGTSSERQVEERYGRDGALQEIGWCILFHAANMLIEAGGRSVFDANEPLT